MKGSGESEVPVACHGDNMSRESWLETCTCDRTPNRYYIPSDGSQGGVCPKPTVRNMLSVMSVYDCAKE